MNPSDWLMEHTLPYRIWQAPFATRKLAPLLLRAEPARARCVLDVGCGPGTNFAYFRHATYHGVDINRSYIASARRRYGKRFWVADVTTADLNGGRYDFILINSLLHHLNDNDVDNLLARLSQLLTEDGAVHILDLVLPNDPSIARWLARMDRGDFPRSVLEWQKVLSRNFSTLAFEPYSIGVAGTVLWKMIYFKGASART